MLTLPKTFNSSDISCFKIWVTTFLYIADCAEINFSYNTCILIVVKRICEWVVNYLLIFFLFYFIFKFISILSIFDFYLIFLDVKLILT